MVSVTRGGSEVEASGATLWLPLLLPLLTVSVGNSVLSEDFLRHAEEALEAEDEVGDEEEDDDSPGV